MLFISPTRGSMTIEEVANDIHGFMEQVPDTQYRVIVGSDSQPHSARHGITFVTAIVVHRVGKGARFYILKRPYDKPMPFRQRIFSEAAMALEIVQVLEEALDAVGCKLPVEIHLDIGQDGETKALIKDIVGWVTQSGYEAKIKPDSFGAGKVADRYTKS